MAFLYTIIAGQPSIDYTKLELDRPLAPNGLVLIHGKLKNFGSTMARDYSVGAFMSSCPSSQGIKQPKFTLNSDEHGQVNHPAIHDLAPSQEDEIRSSGKYWQLDPGAYEEVVTGKRNIAFFTIIHYRDILFIPHTKVLCNKYAAAFINGFVRCNADEIVQEN